MSHSRFFSRALPLAVAVATASACYVGGSDGVTIQPMELVSADWNLTNADVGKITTAVDLDDQLVVFSDKGMFVVSGGVVSAADNTVTAWGSAAAIPAADGNGNWAVGVVRDPTHADPNDGKVYRVYAASKLDAVSDRYGLLGSKVLGVARASSPEAPGAVAFALDGGVAYTDGVDVHRYDLSLVQITASGWRVAGVAADGSVGTLDLDPKVKTHDGKAAKITIDGVRVTAFDGDRLAILSDNALYRERADRTWDLIFSGDALHGLVATPNGLWFGSGTSLCLYDGTTLQCAPANLQPDAVLVGSARGVYAIEGGKMRALERKASGAEALWRASVRPVFARVCSSCHGRGGSSGIDLSSYASWAGRVAQIDDRVVKKKNMPTNQTLSGTDYQIVVDWVACQQDATKCAAQ